MKKVLFIDRDGTLIREPANDYQVDSLEKLEFLPGVFRNLYKLRHFTDYELVLVSNQDGLGSPSFPRQDFDLPHFKFLEAFRNEGVVFDAIHIDPSLPEENSPNRKPGTGMLKAYMDGGYDLQNSSVIGDRTTEVELAANTIAITGTGAIGISPVTITHSTMPSCCRVRSARAAHPFRLAATASGARWATSLNTPTSGTGSLSMRRALRSAAPFWTNCWRRRDASRRTCGAV